VSFEGDTEIVEPEAYCRLVTSRRRLERCEDRSKGLVGVYDPERRVRYMVERFHLLENRPALAAVTPN
jgi:hypothetical protein